MLNGYVGIVSRKGLCQFQIERQDTLRLAHQAAITSSKQARVGFWAILPIPSALAIFALIEQGESKEALRLLNQTAREGGHLIPLNQ